MREARRKFKSSLQQNNASSRDFYNNLYASALENYLSLSFNILGGGRADLVFGGETIQGKYNTLYFFRLNTLKPPSS